MALYPATVLFYHGAMVVLVIASASLKWAMVVLVTVSASLPWGYGGASHSQC